MSSRNSGIWLGTQGVLALVRVAIWIADPAFDDHKWLERTYCQSPNLSESQLGFVWNSRHLGSWNGDFNMPVWAIDMYGKPLHELFAMAFMLYTETGNPQIDLLAQLQNAKEQWDMPGRLFMLWVNRHSHPNEPLPTTERWSDYGARVIMDNEGNCHVLPFWTADVLLDPIYYRIELFGNIDDKAAPVICCSKESYKDEWPQNKNMTRGWQTPIVFDENDSQPEESVSALQLLEQRYDFDSRPLEGKYADERWPSGGTPFVKSAIREEAIKTIDTMWKDVIHIFKLAAAQQMQQLPEIFLKEREPRQTKPTVNRADLSSSLPETSGLRHRRQSL